MDFDEAQLRRLIRYSSRRSQFYKVLREELMRQGNWRDRRQGTPGFKVKKEPSWQEP